MSKEQRELSRQTTQTIRCPPLTFRSELTDLVSLETCVQLQSPGSCSPTPELSFSISTDLAISALKVISEARIIELYGKGGEYMSTTHSDFLDDFEGMAVYSAFVKLAVPSSDCSIKFKKLKNEDSIWLYGMGIYIQPCQGQNYNGVQVDFKRVNDRLQQSGCSLTGNAEQCLELLHTFQTFSHGERKAHSNLNCVDGRISQSVGNAETYKKMCDLLLGVTPKFSGLRSATQGSANAQLSPPSVHNKLESDKPDTETQSSSSMSSSVNDGIKALLTEQFQRLENSLMAKIDERLKTIEDKLDVMMLAIQTQTLSLDSKM
ncbi:uncharacterized protein [Hetaerina americana]|uniref:uncharacterized protein isoform X2 n=1 Tax=Hetaerina americana TaxID=62018 RepID=UPI003A7F1822